MIGVKVGLLLTHTWRALQPSSDSKLFSLVMKVIQNEEKCMLGAIEITFKRPSF